MRGYPRLRGLNSFRNSSVDGSGDLFLTFNRLCGRFGEMLEDGLGVGSETVGLGRENFQQADDGISLINGSRHHGTNSECPTTLLIDARVFLGVIASQQLASANAFS